MKNTVRRFKKSEQLLRRTQVAKRNYYEKGNLWCVCGKYWGGSYDWGKSHAVKSFIAYCAILACR